MRVLIHHDYESARVTTIVAQVMYMYEHPGEMFMTVFDYSKGRVGIDVRPVADYPAVQLMGVAGREWSEELSRAARSNGKTEIHVMIVVSSGKLRWFVVPLRTNSSEMHDALKRLAEDIPAGADTPSILPELTEKIQTLVDNEGPGVVRIHS
ncbi:hypothetical protein B0H13DRAFT_2334936 [Mycena leptocephala]|nr:hypothetical protein B0H13DRAFT_2334936 [Mycena leptocephala]